MDTAPQSDIDVNEFEDEVPLPPRRVRRRAKFAVNLTSLIDVTFLLLIYFIMATSMTGNEEVFRMELPGEEGRAGSAGDPFALDEDPLRIAVTSTGMSADMYRLRIEGPYPQPQTFQELHDFLASKQVNEANAGNRSGALFRPQHPIIIQPSRSTRWEHAIEALNAAARAQYTNITFAKPM
jgi:biopolymer transport protein ExbD